MKQIAFIIGCLFLISGMTFAQGEAQKGEISFNETIHDFGMVSEKQGFATCEFVLTNNTDNPVLINRVTVSCGCTTPVWTREPVEPGKTGTITVRFNPIGRPGTFNKPVSVYVSDTRNVRNPYHLSIKGTVLTEDQDPAKSYPNSMGSLLVKNKSLDFGQIFKATQSEIDLEVFNNSDAPFDLRLKNVPSYLKIQAIPASIGAKSSAKINVKFDASVSGYGTHEGKFSIYSDNIPYEFPYKAFVVDNFSNLTDEEKANAGRLNLNVKEINFDNLKSGSTRTLKFSNSGKRNLQIKLIQSSDPLLTVSAKSLTIKPNEIKEVKLILDKKAKVGFSTVLTLFSDDPTASIKTINVKTTL